MRIKYIISSYINGYHPALIKLVDSLLSCGIDSNDIYAFVGGADKTELVKWEYDINYYLVDHNSFDMTALIGMSNLDVDYDYAFLLHDTSYVGPKFLESITERLSEMSPKNTILLCPYGHTMNMGMYSRDYIMSKKETLNTHYKGKDKSFYVSTEDKLIRETNNPKLHLDSDRAEVLEPFDFYNTNTLRRVEYFKNIDLYKIKANWGQSRDWVNKL